MPRIRGHIVIAQPVEVVFDFVADERNEPSFNPRMVRADKVTEGPIGSGTRFAALLRTGRRTAALEIEYTAFERPAVLASTSRMSSGDIVGRLTFEPIPGGTRMSWDWEVRLRGVPRLLGPLVALMGSRQERRIWSGLKQRLEASAAASPVLSA
jgi:hypothetical protein